jgi:hypothetical protein
MFQWASDPALSSLTIENPVATTARTSVYNVTVTDADGPVQGSVTLTIAGPLQAGLDQYPAVAPILHNTPVMFDAGRSTGNNPIMLFEWWANWNPNNPTPPDVSDQFAIRPTFTYPNSGPATVRLRITDSVGSLPRPLWESRSSSGLGANPFARKGSPMKPITAGNRTVPPSSVPLPWEVFAEFWRVVWVGWVVTLGPDRGRWEVSGPEPNPTPSYADLVHG